MAKMVFLLHGIRTHAGWQRAFADVAARLGWKCPLDGWWYGRFSLFQFLTPFARKAKVAWFRRRYTAALREHQRTISASSNRLPSIVAHSFGTYILGYALLKYKDIKFDKVIMCGSILPREFPWRELIDRGQIRAVRNDVGLQDIWTEFSSWVVPGTGASGTQGFEPNGDRFFQHHHNLTHSEFFDSAWMEQHWFPFLQESFSAPTETADTTAAIRLPRGDRPVAATTISSFVLLIYVVIVASLLFYASRFINPPVYATEFALRDTLTKDLIYRGFELRYAVDGVSTELSGSKTCVIPAPDEDIEIIDVRCPGYTFQKAASASGNHTLWMERVAIDPEHPENRPPRGIPLFEYAIRPSEPKDDPAVPEPSDEEYFAAIDDQSAEIDGEAVRHYTLTCDNQTPFHVDILFFRKNVTVDKAPPRWSHRRPPCPPFTVHEYEFIDKTRGYHFIYGSFCGQTAQYLAQGSLTQSGRPILTIRMNASDGDRLTGSLAITSPLIDSGSNDDEQHSSLDRLGVLVGVAESPRRRQR